MRLRIVVAIVLSLFGCSNGRWELQTIDGKSIDLKKETGYQVLMFISADCPLSQLYAKSFSALGDSFPDFHFIGISPGKYSDETEIRDFREDYGFEPDVLLDPDLELSRDLQAEVTPHFFVLDPEKKIIYDGAMDDWAIDLARKKIQPKHHYLIDALHEISQGRSVTLSQTDPVGCIIEYNDQ